MNEKRREEGGNRVGDVTSQQGVSWTLHKFGLQEHQQRPSRSMGHQFRLIDQCSLPRPSSLRDTYRGTSDTRVHDSGLLPRKKAQLKYAEI